MPGFFHNLTRPQKIIVLFILAVVSIVALVGLSETHQDYYVSAAVWRAIFIGVLLLILFSPILYLTRNKTKKEDKKSFLEEELSLLKEEVARLKQPNQESNDTQKTTTKHQFLTIEEVANLTNEPVPTINYWTEESVLTETSYGSKLYHPSMVQRVKKIRHLYSIKHLTTEEIITFFKRKKS